MFVLASRPYINILILAHIHTVNAQSAMQINKWVWHSLLAQAAFILAIKNNDVSKPRARRGLPGPALLGVFARSLCLCTPTPLCFCFLFHPLTPCRPRVWTASLWDRLNLTKLIFRRRRRTTALPPPLLLLLPGHGWHFAMRKCVILGVGGRESTRELSQLRVQNIPRGPAPTF